jgi:hypothetical protein
MTLGRSPTFLGWLLMLLLAPSLVVFGVSVTAFADAKQDSVQLPPNVNIRLMRTLERQLSDVERALVDQAKLPKERVRNVTMPFQNFIDDVVLASGRYTDVYPRAIYEVLVTELNTSKPKSEIANSLIDYQKKGRFKALAESQRSKTPKKGSVGT